MNRAALQSFRQIGQTMREELRGDVVTIDGTEYDAAVAPSAVRRVPTAEAWQNQQDLRVDVRKTLLEERPGLGVSIKWQGLTFSLDSCGGDEPDSLCWTIRANRIC